MSIEGILLKPGEALGVFRITAAGTFNTLHSFDCHQGCQPQAGLIQASDGKLYGTAQQGGPGVRGFSFASAVA